MSGRWQAGRGPDPAPCGPVLLVDIGSTIIKLCRYDGAGLGAVRRVPRQPGRSPGEQVGALVDEVRLRTDPAAVRVCSSANGGLRVGVLGLTRRHSVAAAARAAVAAGANVCYARVFDDPAADLVAPVDLLVLTGGVDGADLRHLRARLAAVPLASYPHQVLVWSGAYESDVLAGLPVDHVVPNVLDAQLRTARHGLTGLIHQLYVGDLVDRKGLRALAGTVTGPIWPTPAVVGLAAEGLARNLAALPAAAPFVVVDIGGATTDVLYCAELAVDLSNRIVPAESIVRRVFTDLGVASSLPRLRQRLADEPGLVDLATAVAPEHPRALYHQLVDRAELSPATSFLACLFLAVRQLAGSPGQPDALPLARRDGQPQLDARRIASIVITGGAWRTAPEPAIRRVINAACGVPDARWGLHLDRRYQLWAYGLLEVPTYATAGGQAESG